MISKISIQLGWKSTHLNQFNVTNDYQFQENVSHVNKSLWFDAILYLRNNLIKYILIIEDENDNYYEMKIEAGILNIKNFPKFAQIKESQQTFRTAKRTTQIEYKTNLFKYHFSIIFDFKLDKDEIIVKRSGKFTIKYKSGNKTKLGWKRIIIYQY